MLEGNGFYLGTMNECMMDWRRNKLIWLSLQRWEEKDCRKMRREPGGGREVNGRAKQADNRDRSSAPQGISCKGRKAGRWAWESLVMILLHKRWHKQGLGKKKEEEKKKPICPRLNFYEIRLRSHNTKLRVATAGLLLQTLAMSCAQHFDVLGMHMGLMHCDN